ncbi:MAG TPA: protein kinase [Thermoleophilaceae bacterium]
MLEPGVLVDGHEIEREVHDPAGAELRYLARSPDGTPAMVITSRRMFADRGERSRFRRLSATLSALDHQAAIRIRAVTEYANRPVLITDPYPDTTLGDLLEDDAPLAPERVVTLLAPLADALDRANAVGLVHSTLSADSVLLASGDRPVLDTFGLVAEDHGAWSVVMDRDVRYMSPEQVRGLPAVPASNIYSLTALAVHALTGEPPFTGEPPAVMYAHVIKAPEDVTARRPELGARIDWVVSSGMAKEPEGRPTSAMVLVQMLAHALEVATENGASAPRPRHRRGSGSRRTAAVVAAAVGVGALTALAVGPFGDGGSEAVPAAQPVAATAWDRLAGQRAELRDQLAAADTPKAQAAAATALGDLYARAARIRQSPALAAAARDASAAYTGLASAAGSNDDAGYLDAARAVERAEGRLSLAASRH